MTWRKRTIMEMAREAWAKAGEGWVVKDWFDDRAKAFEAFAELIRADEVEKYKWDVHSCGPTCTKVACVAMREAVLAEREACAKVCEALDPICYDTAGYTDCAAAIRARGKA